MQYENGTVQDELLHISDTCWQKFQREGVSGKKTWLLLFIIKSGMPETYRLGALGVGKFIEIVKVVFL